MAFDDTILNEALYVLGELLQDEGEAFDIVLIGGGALLLLGLIDRPTKDLDVVARVEDNRWVLARPFPYALNRAVLDVADALDLATDWLNPGPTDLLVHGLPEGFADRATIRTFGSLVVRFGSRSDHVALKLYAAADHWPDQSKHFVDLKSLEPTEDELRSAAAWCRTHDPSEGFCVMQLHPVLAVLGIDSSDV